MRAMKVDGFKSQLRKNRFNEKMFETSMEELIKSVQSATLLSVGQIVEEMNSKLKTKEVAKMIISLSQSLDNRMPKYEH